MDIEKLTKSQIVLLTLLVSFVTSIATGIVTVALVEQAPPNVTASVNRVIEHTIQKVVPASQSASVASTAQTIIVHESDAIAAAVGKATPSLVRIYTAGDSPSYLGLGAVLTKDGLIVTDESILGDTAEVSIMRADGIKVRMLVTKRDEANGLAYLTQPTSSSTVNLWSAISMPQSQATLGESVIVLAGKATTKIGSGIITSLVPDSGSASTIDTNLSPDAIMHGSILIDERGACVGISTAVSRTLAPSAFVPAQSITVK